jgi:hypothetical protein
MEILKKDKNEGLTIKILKNLIEMKTSFYGPISKLDITKERIRELEDM